jgi:hypothetical protein
MNDQLMTPEAVSEYTHITTGGLATARYTGKGPKFLKPTAKTVLYRKSDVDAWLDASERTITGGVLQDAG